MKTTYRFYIFLLFFAISFTQELSAAPVSKQAIEINDFLQSINSLKSDFVQTDSQGQKREGRIFIQKPAKIRVEYYTPDKELITISDELTMHYNYDLEEKNYAKPSDVFLDFLSKRNFSLLRDCNIMNTESSRGIIKVIFSINNDEMDRIFSLTIDNTTKTIREIAVKQDVETITFKLINPSINTQISSELFDLDNLHLQKNKK